MARMITYDELNLSVMARHDLTKDERAEVLKFIRQLDERVKVVVDDQLIPPELRGKIEVVVGR